METPAGKLVVLRRKVSFCLLLMLLSSMFFLLDSQVTGNTVGKIEEVPKSVVVVASTSQVISEVTSQERRWD